MSAHGTRSSLPTLLSAIGGCRKAQQRFIQENEALIHKVVRHYAYAHEWQDDLFQEAALGLLKALPKFDVNRGLNFSTYALPWMRVYVERFIQANMHIVSMPTRTQALAYRVKGMASKKTHSDIAHELGLTLESVEGLLELGTSEMDIDHFQSINDPALLAEHQIELARASIAFNKFDTNQQDIALLALDIHPDYDSVSAYEKSTGFTRAQITKQSKSIINSLQLSCG